jgi:hypothetical protein
MTPYPNAKNQCAVGHIIVASFAFHDDHFLWGHSCPVDGRYWAYDPCSDRVAIGDTMPVAMDLLGGSTTSTEGWLARYAAEVSA